MARSLLSANPFTLEIQEYCAPKNFQCPVMPIYDGTEDPSDHLIDFQAKMMILGAEDPMYCRVFFSTLKGAAQRWFLSLPPRSIDCFETLGEQFLTYFAGNIKTKRHFTALTAVQQGETETLKEFLGRWKKEIQTVEGLDDRTAITLFMETLKAGDLFASLRTDIPETYAQAIQRANRYAETEEALRQKQRQREKRPLEETRTRPVDRLSKRRDRINPSHLPVAHRPRVIPTLGARAVHEIHPPRVREDPPPQNPATIVNHILARQGKYCRFHESPTHSTEECTTLQKELEGLIEKRIALKRNMGRPPQGGRQPRGPNQWQRQTERPRQERRPGGREAEAQPETPRMAWEPQEEQDDRSRKHHKLVIHMICGGPIDGDSARERKRWARQLYIGAVHHKAPPKKGRRDPIIFSDDDLPEGPTPHRDTILIAMDVNGATVRWVFVDTGSIVNVMYLGTFTKLGLTKENLHQVRTPLAGFTGDSIEPEGCITLPIEIGEYSRVRAMNMEFVVVDLKSTHNVILGRPGLEDLGAIGSRDLQVQTITERTTKEEARDRPEPTAKLEEVALESSKPDQRVRIGKGLTEETRSDILRTLQEYRILFTWGPEDMPGIDRSVITHCLSVDPAVRPIVQRKRHLAANQREFVKKEVATLLEIGHLKEVVYPAWLENVVLVPKPPAWRMCVDYTDLNKACPKDLFPLPRIDQLVD
ncbi:uncharacterized protein LOC115995830 [Ipomoea triloba]|uniref:uncharacterized protein LOC115995830 n=1 Tax=Ipomoea triloba TaxID=35885 RepID=UPI00125DCEA0|nr:uncharacterized protein LOC115995830 [Ipomoea triloba]